MAVPSDARAAGAGRPPAAVDALAWAARLAAATGAMAVALEWWRAPSLWVDEIFVALNLGDRGWTELASPLDYRQVAPIGFLLLEKLAFVAGDGSERALRLAPSLAAAAAILLLPAWLRRFAPPLGAAAAAWVAVSAAPLHLHAVQAKPAGFDLLAAVAIPLALLAAVEGGAREKRRAGALAAALATVSFATSWVLAAGLLGLLAAERSRRSLLADRAWRAPIAVAAAFATAVPLLARLRLAPGTIEYLAWFWRDSRPQPPAGPGELAEWILDWTAQAVRTATGAGGRAAALVLAGLAVTGLALAARRGRPAALPAALLASAMALTAAGVYPAHGRLALFLAPAWLAGLAAVIGAADRLAAGPLRIAVAVALVGAGAVRASELRIGAPRQRPRELVAAVGALLRPGDLVYVRPAAVPAWRHYAPRTGLPADVRVVLGVCARDRPAATALELERLRGERRVWALFSHTGVLPEHERAVERLLGAAGRARARIQADPSPRPAASDFAGLYDLSATERFDRALATHELARLRAAPPLSCRQYDGPAGGAG